MAKKSGKLLFSKKNMVNPWVSCVFFCFSAATRFLSGMRELGGDVWGDLRVVDLPRFAARLLGRLRRFSLGLFWERRENPQENDGLDLFGAEEST